MPTFSVPTGVFPYHGGFLQWNAEVAKTASYQILVTDNGTRFTNRGASGSITFTLPAIAANLRFGFIVVANQNVILASKEGGNIIAFNNAAASNLAWQSAGALIGGALNMQSSQDGTLWYVEVDNVGANTLTIS